RRELHAAVARAMERLHADRLDEHAAIIAHHFEAAGEHVQAVPYLVRAANRARATYANVEAVRLYQAAVEHLNDGSATADDGVRSADTLRPVLRDLGDVLELIGRHEDALAAYQRALDVATTPLLRAELHRKRGT